MPGRGPQGRVGGPVAAGCRRGWREKASQEATRARLRADKAEAALVDALARIDRQTVDSEALGRANEAAAEANRRARDAEDRLLEERTARTADADRARAELTAAKRRAEADVRRERERADDLADALAGVRAELERAESEIARLSDEAGERDGLEAERARLERERAELSARNRVLVEQREGDISRERERADAEISRHADAAAAARAEAERLKRELADATARAERAEAGLDKLKRACLPMPPRLQFGQSMTVPAGSGFQQMRCQEIGFRADGSTWAGDGSRKADLGSWKGWLATILGTLAMANVEDNPQP